MERKEIGNKLDRENRNNHNENYEYLFKVVVDAVNKIKEEINQEVLNQIIEESRVNWLEAVNDESDLPSDANIGDAIFVINSNKGYRWDGNDWVFFQALDSSAVDALRQTVSGQIQDFMTLYENLFEQQETTFDDLFQQQKELTQKKTIEVSATEPEHAEVWFEVV